MEMDPSRMCELLVGLPAVRVLGIDDDPGGLLAVHVETIADRPSCAGCGGPATLKDWDVVTPIDLPCFGRGTRLVSHKDRWCCVNRPVRWGRGRDRTRQSPPPA